MAVDCPEEKPHIIAENDTDSPNHPYLKQEKPIHHIYKTPLSLNCHRIYKTRKNNSSMMTLQLTHKKKGADSFALERRSKKTDTNLRIMKNNIPYLICILA